MWAVIRRAIVPAVLVGGGAVAWIYGAKVHSAPVVEEKEETITRDVPVFDPLRPAAPPVMRKETLKKSVRNVLHEPEPVLMRDVSVGGIARLANGELKRTYSGKAPSLCPT